MHKIKASNLKYLKNISLQILLLLAFGFSLTAQESPPAPTAPRVMKIPSVEEKKLPNNLTIAVAERKNVPLVTVQLLIKSGANAEKFEKAGLANLTASLLTKGTKTRTATQIAEEFEFLGATIESGADWNKSIVSVNVMADKLDQALAILSDLVLNANFDQKEIEILKTQVQDGLAFNLKQPGFLANYAASKYSFAEHPAGGTPESLGGIGRDDIVDFRNEKYRPEKAVLIFAGDVSAARAETLARKYFGMWKAAPSKNSAGQSEICIDGENVADFKSSKSPLIKRVLIVDLPNSGQASVNYALGIKSNGRSACRESCQCESNRIFYPALVLNSVLGGGYSARLNQEIRIKRGLSYGAGSSFAWRSTNSNFSTRTQTKNESAAEVAELVLGEVKKLAEEDVPSSELAPRKSVLTGNFGREFETTDGLAQTVAALYTFGLPLAEMNTHMQNVDAVAPAAIKSFASEFLKGGDLIIVGDYAIFKDDLAKRFPNLKIEVVKADELDLSKENLKK